MRRGPVWLYPPHRDSDVPHATCLLARKGAAATMTVVYADLRARWLNGPQVASLQRLHLATFISGQAGLVFCFLASTGVILLPRLGDDLRLAALAVGAHVVLSALVLLWQVLRAGRPADLTPQATLERLGRVLLHRVILVAVLAVTGQAVVVATLLLGATLQAQQWLLLALVPSFLQLSMGLRRWPNRRLLDLHASHLLNRAQGLLP